MTKKLYLNTTWKSFSSTKSPPRNINSPINVHKMLLTYYKIQANLIMLDGPYFILR